MSDKSEEKYEHEESQSLTSTDIACTWNESQEKLLKGISERSNCMRWLHNQCQIYFESMNFYLTIPNVIISTLNGSFTMALNSLFPNPDSQQAATTVIGLVSIFSAVLITMNQYVKSQQMMEAHRSAGLAYGKLHRLICNELALRRDQRQHSLEFLKVVRAEQDRLENTSPTILPKVIAKFNIQFANRDIEKPEIAGDLDEVEINSQRKGATTKKILEGMTDMVKAISPTIKKVSSNPSMLLFNGTEDDRRSKSPNGQTSHQKPHSIPTPALFSMAKKVQKSLPTTRLQTKEPKEIQEQDQVPPTPPESPRALNIVVQRP